MRLVPARFHVAPCCSSCRRRATTWSRRPVVARCVRTPSTGRSRSGSGRCRGRTTRRCDASCPMGAGASSPCSSASSIDRPQLLDGRQRGDLLDEWEGVADGRSTPVRPVVPGSRTTPPRARAPRPSERALDVAPCGVIGISGSLDRTPPVTAAESALAQPKTFMWVSSGTTRLRVNVPTSIGSPVYFPVTTSGSASWS